MLSVLHCTAWCLYFHWKSVHRDDSTLSAEVLCISEGSHFAHCKHAWSLTCDDIIFLIALQRVSFIMYTTQL